MASQSLTPKIREQATLMAMHDGRPRWINYTSLGWKIELAQSGPPALSIKVNPQTRKQPDVPTTT